VNSHIWREGHLGEVTEDIQIVSEVLYLEGVASERSDGGYPPDGE
jgi:hypothetical protein